MYHDYTQEELRTFCRQNIENFEIWARNLIHEKMSANYGPDYINYKVSDENFLIKREIREHVLGMLKKEPSRYNRAVDTLYVDHIIYFLCHDKLYPTLFKEISILQTVKYSQISFCGREITIISKYFHNIHIVLHNSLSVDYFLFLW